MRAMLSHRQAVPTAPRIRETRPYGRPSEVSGQRRAALVMLPHHGAPRSWPETSEGRHNGFLSMSVGIIPHFSTVG